jgi:catechol 2,3-dioxygenase-like lactoylglutathione lyase family enzyme
MEDGLQGSGGQPGHHCRKPEQGIAAALSHGGITVSARWSSDLPIKDLHLPNPSRSLPGRLPVVYSRRRGESLKDFGGSEMFSHVMVASNDIERSKKFYDAVFQAVGGKPGEQDAKGRLRYAHNGGVLMVSKPIDGKPATHSNGGTIGLLMASPEQAAAWHKAGVANGGTSIEDPPGLRGQTYLAYIRDPDGNKLCALCRSAAT